MVVKCPRCKKAASFEPSNKFRPFCSERCQTLDLGAWADEQYRVPVREQDELYVNENSNSENASSDELPPKHHLN